MHSLVQSALMGALSGRPLPIERARELLPLLGSELLDIMAAARVAASRGASRPFTCAVLSAKSGRCPENCAFCAQSMHHGGNAPVRPLIGEDEALFHAERLAGAGVDYLGLVTAGTRPEDADFARLCRMGRRIAARVDIRLCASLGLLSPGQAMELKGSGFTSCHHNLETSRSHYPAVCTSHAYEERVETVENASRAGLRVCSGGIFGIGETWEQRLELSAELAELGVDSIPINYLIPIPGTPLADAAPLSSSEALALIAMLRLMHPDRDILICAGRVERLGRYSPLLFAAGANGLMVGDCLTVKGGPLELDRALLNDLGLGTASRTK